MANVVLLVGVLFVGVASLYPEGQRAGVLRTDRRRRLCRGVCYVG